MSSDKPDRQQRLAEALRANLRRRKGQAREWAAGDAPRDELLPPAEPRAD
jgi:hypothetical protein